MYISIQIITLHKIPIQQITRIMTTKAFAPIPVSVLSTSSVTRDVRKAALDKSPCDVSTIEAILFYDSQL